MKIFIHIGLPKAASTTLQQLLKRDRLPLLGQGAFVPDIGYRKDRRTANGKTDGHDILPILALSRPKLVLFFNQIIKQADGARCDRIILSSENLSHPDNLPDLGGFVSTINRQFVAAGRVEITYVMFDREDETWLRSFYNERVLDGRSFEYRTFELFAEHMTTKGVSSSNIHNECQRLIGEAFCVVGKIDRSVQGPMDKFAEICGITFQELPLQRQRKSPPDDIIEQKRMENQRLVSKPWRQVFKRPDLTARVILAQNSGGHFLALRRAYRRLLAELATRW